MSNIQCKYKHKHNANTNTFQIQVLISSRARVQKTLSKIHFSFYYGLQRVQGVQRVFRKFRKKDLKTFTAISVDRKQLPPWKLLQMTVLTFKTRNISCFSKTLRIHWNFCCASISIMWNKHNQQNCEWSIRVFDFWLSRNCSSFLPRGGRFLSSWRGGRVGQNDQLRATLLIAPSIIVPIEHRKVKQGPWVNIGPLS